MQAIKEQARCFDCNQEGRWAGDAACPKLKQYQERKARAANAKGGGKRNTGRPGGFMQRAGLAMAMLASAANGLHLGGHNCTGCHQTMMTPPPPPAVFQSPPELSDTFVLDESSECLASASDVPTGFAVLDTACLTACGGGNTIDEYIDTFGVKHKTKKSNKIFRGVIADAPAPAENETELHAGLFGKSCDIKFHRLPNSKTPILFSLPQLADRDTVIYCRDKVADFRALDLNKVPLEQSGKGHLMVNISDWNNTKPKPVKPLVESETISVWKAEAEEITKTNGILTKTMKKRVEELQESVKQATARAWKFMKEDYIDLSLKELYAGCMNTSIACQLVGGAVGKPKDIVLGDDLLDKPVQQQTLHDPWTSTSNMLSEELKQFNRKIGMLHLKFVHTVAENCRRGGKHILIEHPLCSQAWRLMPWLCDENGYTGSRMGQCATYLKNSAGIPILRPTRWKGSADILIRFLGKFRCSEDHMHGNGNAQGRGETAQLRNWTPMLGRAIVAGMALQREVEHRYFGGKVMYGKISSHDVFPVEEDTYNAPMSASTRVLFENKPFI